MKREENMKFWRIFFFKFYFFKYLKKFIKNSNNIPSISKTIQHTPITWCTYLQSFEKIQQCVFELQCETWRTDGRTDGRTDRQTDRRTGGVAISPVPGPTAPAGDNKFYIYVKTLTYLAIWGPGGGSIIRLGPSWFTYTLYLIIMYMSNIEAIW